MSDHKKEDVQAWMRRKAYIVRADGERGQGLGVQQGAPGSGGQLEPLQVGRMLNAATEAGLRGWAQAEAGQMLQHTKPWRHVVPAPSA